MLILFQILFTLFTLYALSSVVARKRSGDLGPRGLVFWVLFWVVATVFVWYPEATNRVAQAFGIGRGADFVLYISLVVIFFVLFRLHVKIESMSRDVTKVVRDKALEVQSSQPKANRK